MLKGWLVGLHRCVLIRGHLVPGGGHLTFHQLHSKLIDVWFVVREEYTPLSACDIQARMLQLFFIIAGKPPHTPPPTRCKSGACSSGHASSKWSQGEREAAALQ